MIDVIIQTNIVGTICEYCESGPSPWLKECYIVSLCLTRNISRQRGANKVLAQLDVMPSILSDETRRRNYTPASQGNGTLTGTKRMKDAPTLEHVTPRIDPQGRMTVPEAVDMFGAMIYSTLPVMISWGMTMSLIFGGCCSNVWISTG